MAAHPRPRPERMAAALTHRGPDDHGVWVDEAAGVALGHRRLSILDLSAAGHQPMTSPSGRYVIAYNGEIYNHLDLRAELERNAIPLRGGAAGPPDRERERKRWRGHSDTETLLAGFEVWGVETTLKKAVGMFAFALWDRETAVLTLARDRLGEKPLYYGFRETASCLLRNSRLSKPCPGFSAEIDRDTICLFLRYCYIPAPNSIYRGIGKLLPGTYLQLNFGQGATAPPSIAPIPYWSLAQAVEQGLAQPYAGSEAEAIAGLEKQLAEAIGMQMVADVPLGTFLSGGVDSSTVAALMQAQSSRPINTFSIGFSEQGYNEAEYAKAVARHLGTHHTELYVSPTEAMQVIPLLGRIYDEPFADSSQVPTFLLSRMTRQHVTVSLSGDGGDELFYGYNRHALADRWEQLARIQFAARRAEGHLLNAVAPGTWEGVFAVAGRFAKLPANPHDKLGKLARQLERVDRTDQLYASLVSVVDSPDQVVIGGREPVTAGADGQEMPPLLDAKACMMYLDMKTYLPDDILVKVDRAAMANSLETRVPYLDHRVIEAAWSLPMSMKLRGGESKWILRQILHRHVPQSLIDRPKAGFAIPLADWLRGGLCNWAEALLSAARLKREGFFDASQVRSKWQEHLDGRRNHQTFLWNVLMFQVWLETRHEVG